MSRGSQHARAQAVFDDCRGLTPELIVDRLARALEMSYAEGAQSTALQSRRAALREVRHVLAGLEASVKQHTRTCEIELVELEKKP
jgi:hypothetical protein